MGSVSVDSVDRARRPHMARKHLMQGSSPKFSWRPFASPGDLARALAVLVADRLRSALHRRGQALIAVSGGTTPALFFRTLSNEELDWSKVTVTLVDERF